MKKYTCKNCKYLEKNKYAPKKSDFSYFCAHSPLATNTERCSLFSPNLLTKSKHILKSILTAIGFTTYDEPEEHLGE